MSCLTIQWVFFWFYTYSHNTCTLFTKKNITHTVGVNLIYHVCKFSFCWGVAHWSHYGTQFSGQDESLTISVEHGEGIFKHYKICEYQFKRLQNWITFSSGYKCVQVWDITCTPCWLYFKWLTCNSFWFDSFHLENIIKQTFLVYLFWKNQPILNKWNYFFYFHLYFFPWLKINQMKNWCVNFLLSYTSLLVISRSVKINVHVILATMKKQKSMDNIDWGQIEFGSFGNKTNGIKITSTVSFKSHFKTTAAARNLFHAHY